MKKCGSCRRSSRRISSKKSESKARQHGRSSKKRAHVHRSKMTSDQNVNSSEPGYTFPPQHGMSSKLDLVEEVIDASSNDSTERIFDFSGEDISPCFVAVHLGAGYHSAAKTGAYRDLCERTCANVIELLKQGSNARTAVATAVALLEVFTVFIVAMYYAKI
jgi:hypothetical protein